MNISHEAIYQALYVQAAGSLRQELKLEKALRTGRKGRKARSPLAGSTLTKQRRNWVQDAHISLRPPEVDDRAVWGHWEGDLVIGGDGKTALITLVERTTRFVLIRRLPVRHDSKTVTTELADMVTELNKPGM